MKNENKLIVLESSRPVGVFDSGIGGLTVLKALRQHFPKESFIYLGDTARLPYGTKSPETVIKYAESLTQELLNHDVKAIVIACNTASTHALHAVTQLAPHLPVIGMIEPAASAATQNTKNNHIAVMGTFGTIKSNVYLKAIQRLRPDIKISSVPCQMLVALAEEGWTNDSIAKDTLHRYLDAIFDSLNPPDTLILGCTHFPLFLPLLKDILGPAVGFINSGEVASLTLKNYLKDSKDDILGTLQFLVTDDPIRFAENASKFYDDKISIKDITLIDIR